MWQVTDWGSAWVTPQWLAQVSDMASSLKSVASRREGVPLSVPSTYLFPEHTGKSNQILYPHRSCCMGLETVLLCPRQHFPDGRQAMGHSVELISRVKSVTSKSGNCHRRCAVVKLGLKGPPWSNKRPCTNLQNISAYAQGLWPIWDVQELL